MPVMIGATPEGRKQLVGVQVGLRESARSWRELPVDLTARGFSSPPGIAAGDGAPGFRKALEAVVPSFGPRHQRGRTRKVSDIPNTIPKSIHPAVKADPREIRRAGTCAAAAAAADAFAETWGAETQGAKHGKAVVRLTRDREARLAVHDVPAAHRDHLRMSTPIESVSATVRHRTVRPGGARSRTTAKPMAVKSVQGAAKTCRLNGANQLPPVVAGVEVTDGVAEQEATENRAA